MPASRSIGLWALTGLMLNNMIGSGRIDVGNAYRDIIFIDGLDD